MEYFAQQFPPDSRIWIYQCNRNLTETESIQIKHKLKDFASSWSSHEIPLSADADIFYNRFIVFVVNSSLLASGCSIDKSVALVKSLENEFNISLFDRLNVAWQEGNGVNSTHYTEFLNLLEQGKVNENTLIFDNTINQLKDLEDHWIVPVKESWIQNAISH